jgi:hypothetical protein
MSIVPYAPIQSAGQNFDTLNPYPIGPQPLTGIDRLQATQISELSVQKNNRTQLQSYSPVEKTLMTQIQLVYNTLNPLNRKKIRKLLWQKTHHTRQVSGHYVKSATAAAKLGVAVGAWVDHHHHVEKDTPRDINDKGLKQVYDRARMYFGKQIKSVGTNIEIQARKQLNYSISHQKFRSDGTATKHRGARQREWKRAKDAASRDWAVSQLQNAPVGSAAGTIKKMLATKEKKKAKRVGRRMAVQSGIAQQAAQDAADNDEAAEIAVDQPQAPVYNPGQQVQYGPGGPAQYNAPLPPAPPAPVEEYALLQNAEE